MAKRTLAEDAKFSTITMAHGERVRNALPVEPDGNPGKRFPDSTWKKGDRGSDGEEEVHDGQGVIVAETQPAEPGTADTGSPEPVLQDPQSATGAQERDSVKSGEKDDSNHDSNAGWWWLGGVGLAAAATGIGVSFSGNEPGANTQTAHSNDMVDVPTPNVPPSLGNYTVTLAENSGNGTTVQTVAATDDNGDGITYSITAGNTNGAFAIDAASGVLSVADASNLDFETIKSFSLTVQASDGSLAGTGTVTINLTDRNDNTPVINSGNTGIVAENSPPRTVIYNATATDADAGSTITYSLKTGGDAALLDIDPVTGAVMLKNSADFETKPGYSFTVIASDGTNSSEQPVTVSVTDINDNSPVFNSGDTGTITENAPTHTAIYNAAATDADAGTTITYGLKTGSDAALLNIDPVTGAVTLKSAADFEAKPAYSFTVIADDGTNNSEQTVAVNVTDLNDNAPVFTSGGTGTVAENSPTSTAIYQAIATDADAGTTLTYSLKTGGDASLLDIDPASGAVTLKTPANFETKHSYNFTVIADDGHHNCEQTVTVSVSDINDPPVITSNGGGATATMSVAENQTAVTTVTSTDEDTGDSKTFSITGGADGALFAIDSATGVLTFLAAPDHEARADADHNNIYDVQVAVTDSGGLSDVQDLAVTVSDIKEHFVVEASGAWIDLNANGVRDGSDTVRADFTPGTGNIDLSAINGVIHYNNVPNASISLAGFSADDRIEIDAQTFIDNGHGALQILTRPHIKTLDALSAYGTSHIGNTGNSLVTIGNGTGTRYHNSHTYLNISADARSVAAGLTLHGVAGGPRSLDFNSNDGPTAMNGQLASQLSPDLLLQQSVDFVNIPETTTVRVIVERNGAIIDTDGDGVRDEGEDRPAVFGSGGNADLTGGTPVTIHFNNIPQDTLNLTGFGTDDKLELDTQELRENEILRSATRLKSLSALTTITGFMTPFRITYAFNSHSHQPVRFTVRESPLSTPFNGQLTNAHAIMRIAEMGTTISGKKSGAFAYWTDSVNALNEAKEILPGYTGNNEQAVLDTLNSTGPHGGLVDFVWPVNVVVDGDGAWIDTNADGRRDLAETATADLSAGLASNPVTVHLNGMPDGPLDLSGFGSDDRLVIDIDALRYGRGNNLLASQPENQGSFMSDADGFSGDYYGTAGDNAAVFLMGSSVKFGHSTARRSATPSGAFTTKHYYTATGAQEGAIAINAGALAHHFDQVVFVDSGVGPA